MSGFLERIFRFFGIILVVSLNWLNIVVWECDCYEIFDLMIDLYMGLDSWD